MNIIPTIFICLAALTVSCVSPILSVPGNPASEPDKRSRSQMNESEVNNNKLQLPLVQPRIVVNKGKRSLKLYSGGQLVRTYRVALGSNPVDDKQTEGDRSTPEGSFYIFTKNDKSSFYLSLGLSYPNIEDAERGLRDGLINQEEYGQIVDAINKKVMPPQQTALGGEIYIHGNGSQSDWTWGCVALDDKDIRELFDAVQVGTEVVIEH
jgi:murein L,D-transpeptidase YafK